MFTSPHVALALWKTLDQKPQGIWFLILVPFTHSASFPAEDPSRLGGEPLVTSLGSCGGNPNACIDITRSSLSFYFKMNRPHSSQFKALRENHICLLSFPLQKPLFFFFFPTQECLALERGWVNLALLAPEWSISRAGRNKRKSGKAHDGPTPSATCLSPVSPLDTYALNCRLPWRKQGVETESWGFEWGLQGSKIVFILSSVLGVTTRTGCLPHKDLDVRMSPKEHGSKSRQTSSLNRELNEALGLSLSVFKPQMLTHSPPADSQALYALTSKPFLSCFPQSLRSMSGSPHHSQRALYLALHIV